jgi:hypothetical protein
VAAPFLQPGRAGFVERFAKTVTPRGRRAPLRVDVAEAPSAQIAPSAATKRGFA